MVAKSNLLISGNTQKECAVCIKYFGGFAQSTGRYSNMFARGLIFPTVFGGTLILFGFGFYHRYKLIVNPAEKEERRKYNIQQALEFRRKVQDKIDEKKVNP